ncbi:MAG: hypothetical protein COB00_16820 [Alcanivorax sp.]|nr:MAG: hypothetical protein COB00_16820 [Alcanivorax sp.]
MSQHTIKLKMLMLLASMVVMVGCQPQTESAEKTSEAPIVRYSNAKVCEFAQELAALPTNPVNTAELRYLNEQWRELNRSERMFRNSEADDSRAILSELNIALAHETAVLLQQAIAVTAEAYEQIEGLRAYASDPDNMKVPDSITRTLVNKLEDCCLNQLNGNATALVREEKNSALYNIGTFAYFINRDVNQILRNELSLSEYEARVAKASTALPPMTIETVSTAPTWAQCRSAE